MLTSNHSQEERELTFPSNINEKIINAATIIKSANNTVVLTGAGISTPSGVPDFRSAGSGLWTKFLPMEIASLTVFRKEPEKFFEWLRPLASHMLNASPNPAHRALALLEKNGFLKTLITQNIDILHHKAGSKNILEIHGTLNTLSCIGCYKQFQAAGFIEPYVEFGHIPTCPICGHILKPDVILFEEQLPAKTWMKAKKAVKSCDVLIVAGSSLTVMPAAGLPMLALENNAKLIIINQTETYLDERAEIVLSGNVAKIIPQIAKEILGHG